MDLEERTIGFVLKTPLFDGAAGGSLTSEEIKLFLDREEDFEKLRTEYYAPEGEAYLDLLKRNPFLGSHNYGIAKNMIKICSENDYSLPKALVSFISNPMTYSDFGNEVAKKSRFLWEMPPHDLLYAFANLHLLADKIGAIEEVIPAMTTYISDFTKLIEETYARHINAGEEFELNSNHQNLIEDFKRTYANEPEKLKETVAEVRKSFREFTMDKLFLIGNELADLPKVLSLDFCREMIGGHIQSDKTIYLLPSLTGGDLQVIDVLAQTKELEKYVNKYGINFSE